MKMKKTLALALALGVVAPVTTPVFAAETTPVVEGGEVDVKPDEMDTDQTPDESLLDSSEKPAEEDTKEAETETPEKDSENKEVEKPLFVLKSETASEIDKLEGLTEGQVNGYKERIKKAKTKEELETILEDAKVEKDKPTEEATDFKPEWKGKTFEEVRDMEIEKAKKDEWLALDETRKDLIVRLYRTSSIEDIAEVLANFNPQGPVEEYPTLKTERKFTERKDGGYDITIDDKTYVLDSFGNFKGGFASKESAESWKSQYNALVAKFVTNYEVLSLEDQAGYQIEILEQMKHGGENPTWEEVERVLNKHKELNDKLLAATKSELFIKSLEESNKQLDKYLAKDFSEFGGKTDDETPEDKDGKPEDKTPTKPTGNNGGRVVTTSTPVVQTNTVSKANLIKAISDADAVIKDVNKGTTEQRDKVIAALNEARLVRDDSKATQSQVDDAAKKLQIAINEKLYNFFGADQEITYFNDDKYKVMEILNDYAKEQADELTTDEIIENIEGMRIFAQDQYNTCIVNFANYLIDELDYINFKAIEKVDQKVVNYFDFEKFGRDKLIELNANSDVIIGTYEVGKLNDTIIIVTLF